MVHTHKDLAMEFIRSDGIQEILKNIQARNWKIRARVGKFHKIFLFLFVFC